MTSISTEWPVPEWPIHAKNDKYKKVHARNEVLRGLSFRLWKYFVTSHWDIFYYLSEHMRILYLWIQSFIFKMKGKTELFLLPDLWHVTLFYHKSPLLWMFKILYTSIIEHYWWLITTVRNVIIINDIKL